METVSGTGTSVVQHVPGQFGSTLEGFVTVHTDKDPSGTSLLLVEPEGFRLAEVLAAGCAAQQLLLIVDILVTNEA